MYLLTLEISIGHFHLPNYETLIFDSGKGDDADLAWVRINPGNGSAIEFAFKADANGDVESSR